MVVCFSKVFAERRVNSFEFITATLAENMSTYYTNYLVGSSEIETF